jgi:hypothetical protein
MTLKVTCRARFAGGRSSSKCGETKRWADSPKGANAGIQSSQSTYPRDLILYVIHVWHPEWLLGRYPVTFGIRGWQPVRFHEDCERGASGIISPKARPL